MNIGKAIKTIRREKGLSQKDACIKIGITQSYLSQMEAGIKDASIDILKKVSAAYDIPLPMILLMAHEDSDIRPEKKDMFKVLKPLLDNLILQLTH